MKGILLLIATTSLASFAFAQTSNGSAPAKTIQPKITVIPRVADGQDMKAFYDANMNIQIAIAKINEAFQKRGANLRSFDQVLKQMKENQLINKSDGNVTDVKTMILENSGSDIYVEAKIDIVNHTARNAKSVNIILDAYQTGTGNSLASKAITGPMFQTEDVGRLTMNAIDSESENFLNLMQQKFNDITENGQSVYVEFSLSAGTALTFDSEVGTDERLLSEVIEEWFQKNAKNGVYNKQGVTSKKMILSDVRIPLKRPNNPNINYTVQDLYGDIQKYLKALSVKTKREFETNNKLIITIQ